MEEPDAPAPAYPAHWEADVVLRDGTTMRIRPIRPRDADALQRFHRAQSAESTYFRFFAPMERLSPVDLARFTEVDHAERVALVLVSGADIVAVGRFDRIDEDDAEVAFNVADDQQGRGLGSVLLEHLAAAARELGVRRFVADVLPTNTRMLRVFTDAGYDVKQRWDDGVVSVAFTIRPTDRSLEVLAERERRAEALSMGHVLAAESVLVYGSGEEGIGLTDAVWATLAAAPFEGRRVRVAGPEALAGLTETYDLAVVGAPAAELLDQVGVFAARGVRGLVVLTGGFDTDDVPAPGTVPQRALLRALRAHGMRLVGPRSYGLISHGAAGPAPMLLGPVVPQDGPIGVFCQSASAARALLSGLATRSLGVSTLLAAGHRADVSGNDTMQHWSAEEDTAVACLHLESIGNPRKFARVARRLARNRPVVVSIAGSTGQLRPPGHPVQTSHAPRRAMIELMGQSGVLLAADIDQQLDWCAVLASQPAPAGPRVALVTNSGTQNAVGAELVRAAGLDWVDGIPALSPVVGAPGYAEQLAALTGRTDWDAVVVQYGPSLRDDTGTVAATVAAFAAAHPGRTVIAQLHGVHGWVPALRHGGVQVPGLRSLDGAVTALAAARADARRRDQPPAERVDPVGVDRRAALTLVRDALAGLPEGSRVPLGSEATDELLRCYGLSVLPAVRVHDGVAALAAAEAIGWPVAVKTTDLVLRHRADLGGVRLGVAGPDQLAEAVRTLAARMRELGRPAGEFEVQAMAPTGAACVVTAVEDPLYGPLVSFGLGGDAVELLEDVSYRVAPLTGDDVAELVRSVRAAPRLLGHRDLPALDTVALEDVIGRLGVLKEDLPEVAELALNPVLVAETGAVIVSATATLARVVRADLSRRVLPG